MSVTLKEADCAAAFQTASGRRHGVKISMAKKEKMKPASIPENNQASKK
jgi:hypothetical protein